MPPDNPIRTKVIELLKRIKWPADPTFELERSVQLLQQMKGLPDESEPLRRRAFVLLEGVAKSAQSKRAVICPAALQNSLIISTPHRLAPEAVPFVIMGEET